MNDASVQRDESNWEASPSVSLSFTFLLQGPLFNHM